MKQIAEVLTLAAQFLEGHKIEHPRRSAEQLLASVLQVKRIDLYMQYDRPLVEPEKEKMRARLKRAIRKEPIEQIVGEVEFLHCRIGISTDVLIPRQESEILVDLVIKHLKTQSLENKVLWDICTGSGCLGLAIKKACPELTVVLSDISPLAIAVAEQNGRANGLDVVCRMGDLLQPFEGELADFVICNPPYVSTAEYDLLEQSVRDFEPKLALLAGERGTDLFERLAKELPRFLKKGAQCFFEIGSEQGPLVQEIFNTPPWRGQRLGQDWAGHNRFFFLEIE